MKLKEEVTTIDLNDEVPQRVVDTIILRSHLKKKSLGVKKMKKITKKAFVSESVLKNSVDEYFEADHVEVDFQNTGYLDEGILYLDDNSGDRSELSIKWVDGQDVESKVNIRFSVNEPGVIYVNDREISLIENRSNKISGRFKKKNFKESNEDVEMPGSVNSYKKSLGNFLINHRAELNSAKSIEDLIDLVSQAENESNNSYIGDVLEVLSSKRNFKSAIQYIWSIILAGDNLKAI